MSRIPADTLNAVRDRVDIVDLIGRHVGLKEAARTWKGFDNFIEVHESSLLSVCSNFAEFNIIHPASNKPQRHLS